MAEARGAQSRRAGRSEPFRLAFMNGQPVRPIALVADQPVQTSTAQIEGSAYACTWNQEEKQVSSRINQALPL